MKIVKPQLTDLLNYKCMFFDFDGVVLESSDIKTDAFIELFAGLGIEDQVKTHHLANQGVSRYLKFKWITENLLEQTYTDDTKNELADRFASLVKEKVIAAPFVKGFVQMMEKIRGRGIYCVVASGTPQDELCAIVDERGLNPWFEEVHGSPEKKDEIVEDVLNRKGFDRRECLFFGDASTDYEAAEKTELDFYARLTEELAPYWTSAEYTFGTPDFVFENE